MSTKRRSLYCVMTSSITFSLLLQSTPAGGFSAGRHPALKGELTGKGQKHIRDSWSGRVLSIFVVS